MKIIAKQFLRLYLKYLSLLVLAIHRPFVIAVAGSTNKYFIEKEIKDQLLARGKSVRSSPKNFNTEIGLPLAILDLPSGYNSYKRWLPVILAAAKKIFQRDYPSFLVLSLGSSDPGDMKYLLRLVRPRIVVVSDITQRYLEGFSGLDELLREYEYLAKTLKPSDFLLLNHDNYRVASLAKGTQAQLISFGLADAADCRAFNVQKESDGQSFSIIFNKKEERLQIKRFGEHHLYASLAAQIVADIVFEAESGKI